MVRDVAVSPLLAAATTEVDGLCQTLLGQGAVLFQSGRSASGLGEPQRALAPLDVLEEVMVK